MLNSVLLQSQEVITTTLPILLLCTGVSLGLGILSAVMFMVKNTYTKGFVVTLAVLPVIVQMIIMLVNGNLGAGVAVMGAFSLVRFRSTPGGAREITGIFLAMAIGLATGMGYIGIAVMLTLIVVAANLLFSLTRFGEEKVTEKHLAITIPENLDYTEVFDDIFSKYTARCELMSVRTTNLGSLYELRYHVRLKDAKNEKSFIDELRCRNGNLNIILGRIPEKWDRL